MNLPSFIAGRYLFAGKSHNVINVISAISAIGMAIGTAAIILILSVYNGFDGIIEDNLSVLDPDLMVKPAEGKSFIPDSATVALIAAGPEVKGVCRTISENVFATYGDKQSVCTAKGVDSTYSAVCEMMLYHGEIPLCHVGQELARDMIINPYFTENLELWFPDRTAKISPSNPAAALLCEKVHPASVFSLGSSGGKLVILPIENMRSLMKYDDEVSALEIRLTDGSAATMKKIKKEVSELLGNDFKVLDRYEQNDSVYKMMRFEKAAIFLILVFVVFIIAFNIFGSMSMLIIEKKQDMATLSSMGASDGLIRRIFVLEGWMISLLGLAAGLVIGVGLALLQQHTGLVKMPGNYLIESYPAIIRWTDVLLTALAVAAVGFIISIASVPRKS